MNRAKCCLILLLLGCDDTAVVPGAQKPADMADMPGMDQRSAAPTAEDMADMPGMSASSATQTGAGIQPTAAASAMIGFRITPVRAGAGQVPRRAPASVSYDPTASARVTSQSGGQVRSLTVPAPGGAVKRGEVLARIYDPSLHAMLEELRVARTLDEPWRSAAASRARAGGVSDADVRAVLEGGAIPETVAIRSPINGVVAARSVNEGAWLSPGGVIATLVDPKAVLVDLVVDGNAPAAGTLVVLRDPSGNAATIGANVVGALPEATAAGVLVRVQPLAPVAPGRPLVAEWAEETAYSLWVPASALVDTGLRRVVFVSTDAGFVPRPVDPGVRAGDEIEIRSGVVSGESVAAGAAFLLDSETQIGAMGHAGHGAPEAKK